MLREARDGCPAFVCSPIEYPAPLAERSARLPARLGSESTAGTYTRKALAQLWVVPTARLPEHGLRGNVADFSRVDGAGL